MAEAVEKEKSDLRFLVDNAYKQVRISLGDSPIKHFYGVNYAPLNFKHFDWSKNCRLTNLNQSECLKSRVALEKCIKSRLRGFPSLK